MIDWTGDASKLELLAITDATTLQARSAQWASPTYLHLFCSIARSNNVVLMRATDSWDSLFVVAARNFLWDFVVMLPKSL